MVGVVEQKQLQAWRCPRCGCILAKMDLKPGSTVQCKCKCNAMNEFTEPEKGER